MMSLKPAEILLVEDNPDDAELTLNSFQKSVLKNKVHHVKDGAEALEFIFATGAYSDRDKGLPPRMVLLDLKLPKVSGLEVLRRIRSDERTRYLPVVVLTSSREDRDLIDTYALGVNSYIVKPVDFAKFTDAITRLGEYWLFLNQVPPDPRA